MLLLPYSSAVLYSTELQLTWVPGFCRRRPYGPAVGAVAAAALPPPTPPHPPTAALPLPLPLQASLDAAASKLGTADPDGLAMGRGAGWSMRNADSLDTLLTDFFTSVGA